MVTDQNRLRDRVRTLRTERGMTQKRLADLSGMSKAHVYQIESGSRERLRLNTLLSLARALGTEPQHLDPQVEGLLGGGEGVDWTDSLRRSTPLTEREIDNLRDIVEAFVARHHMQSFSGATDAVEQ